MNVVLMHWRLSGVCSEEVRDVRLCAGAAAPFDLYMSLIFLMRTEIEVRVRQLRVRWC
jgi:hypothetical protein